MAGGIGRRVGLKWLGQNCHRDCHRTGGYGAVPTGFRKTKTRMKSNRAVLLGTARPIYQRLEEPFGWIKTVGGLRKTRHRGRELVEWFFVLTAAAYNIIRIPKLLAVAA